MDRINVLKTYKIFIDGKFPRTESGRFVQIRNKKDRLIANVCLSSKKDFRNAVVAARNKHKLWADLSALNRGQILYRIAEMLESSKAQFVEEIKCIGSSKIDAIKEVEQSIDRLIYYAGWSDKYMQIFSTVNPVASQHFNFSIPESVGVVSIISSNMSSLLGLVSIIAPVIVGGNTCIVLSSEKNPMVSISFAEILNNSDVPAGVVNILTGRRKELIHSFASHMDVNSIAYYGNDFKEIQLIKELSVKNLKRIYICEDDSLNNKSFQTPYLIEKFQEIKTVWHPNDV